MNYITVLSFLAVAVAYCSATQVQNCKSGKALNDISSRVIVGNCKKPPCRLRKNTAVDVTMKFKPDKSVDKLVNSVSATIVGVPFPFVGVDGENACNNIFQQDGSTKAACPLEAGKEYIYKTKIDVLQIYPTVKAIVHWGLTSSSGDVICFEVPARITN